MNFRGLNCKQYGCRRGAGLGVAGHGNDVGGDTFFGNHGLESGDDAVLKIAGDGDDADVERDAGFQGGGELVGCPPDEIGEGGVEEVVGRHGLEGVDEAPGIGREVDVAEEAGVAEALGCGLDFGLSRSGACV